MTVSAGVDERLLGQAQEFADTLTATVRAVVGASVDAFTVVGTARSRAKSAALVIRQDPVEGIILRVDGQPMLRLKVGFRCSWDHRKTYLAVEGSTFEVRAVAGQQREPLFRVEYERAPRSGMPSAHLHVHAHRDAITHVMDRCGDKSTRARRRRKSMDKGSSIPRLADLHLPVGGPRFRPCLEDLLQMLIDELGVDAERGAARALAAGRVTWRKMQLAASVRDSPETAARVLEELGYTLSRPKNGPADDRTDKLEAL